ncbi:hypothetical protein ACTXT7_002304 [Hymenolepis weldensis]
MSDKAFLGVFYPEGLVYLGDVMRADRRIENSLNKPTQPNKSSSQFQAEHPIEYIDSGLGESNNDQRPQFDLGYLGRKRQTSSVSLESPDFCEHYQCISSPNAPPSQTSSVLSESDDPWTRQSDIRSSCRFEDHCRDGFVCVGKLATANFKLNPLCPQHLLQMIRQ